MQGLEPSLEISPYDRLYWPDADLLRALASGEHRRELTLFFGPDAYSELAQLSRRASAVTPWRDAPLVWLVPGIMGSQLGIPRAGAEPPDLIWLDPVDVMRGDLYKLRLTPESPVRSLGLVQQSYLRLRLRLQAAGFEVRPFPYDWRRDVALSGAALATQVRDSQRDALIVAHSLGGLVARAAMTDPAADARIRKVVQLGTPNKGAAAARLALNGCYPVVRRAAMLDRRHHARQLAQDIFSTFDSVHQLLPNSCNLETRLATGDDRFCVIAGVGQITCVEAEQIDLDWQYRFERSGDGTVDFDSARLWHADCYVTETEHSELARCERVAAAVIELLRDGATRLLPLIPAHAPSRVRSGDTRTVTERELAAGFDQKIDWAAWSPDMRRHFLENLNAPLPIAALAGF